MVKKLAFLCIAVGTVTAMLWSLSPRSELQSLPELPPSPTPNYIEKRRLPPPPPPPPTWEEFVAKVNGREPQKPGNRANIRR